MDPFGISFSPSDQSGGNGQPQNGQRPTPVQQAIQTLSLRIPRVVGAGGIAPTPLLTSAGGSGLGGNPNAAAMLEQLKRMLFGSPAGTMAPPSPLSSPSPMGDQGPLGSLANMFGAPSQPVQPDQTGGSGAQTSGSGAPLPSVVYNGDSGSGAPLPPDSGVPLPKFDFKDNRPRPEPAAPMPSPIGPPDRGGRGAV